MLFSMITTLAVTLCDIEEHDEAIEFIEQARKSKLMDNKFSDRQKVSIYLIETSIRIHQRPDWSQDDQDKEYFELEFNSEE